ncbi:MAG: hypothetical protein WA139_05805 [Candidatus Aenigmatarchaeota archaeon]
MSLTEAEQDLISVPHSVDGISPAGCQYVHGLFFADGKTIDNIPFEKNVYYENDTDIYSVRHFSKDKFQIVEGSSSACYPPKSHLPVIISGISGVLKQLEKGNKNYEITRKVPQEIPTVFPERYKFSHWDEWYNTMREVWVSRGKVNIRDEYKHEGRWRKGDTFSMVHALPEDTSFLGRFNEALQKLQF